MPESNWKIPYQNPDTGALTRAGISPLLASVLAARGCSDPAEASRLLNVSRDSLHDPLLMLGMEAARDRILRAVADREHVAVYGDYDVDGITSTCLLTDHLRSCGLKCDWYIPDRDEEGYGLNIPALRKLQEAGCTLVITVDCGITAVDEAEFARSVGLDLIITDHHECRSGRIPDACAVIDPKRSDDPYPNPELAGVGVAFKLACACSGDTDGMLARYADLVAAGTVADVMPLTPENRYLVKAGLRKLETDPRPGFAALMSDAGASRRRPSAGYIGFTLAPRLNAAGRLGKTAMAEALLLTSDREEASRIADELRELNRERQKIENGIWREARERLKGSVPDGPIVLEDEHWHQGVIGIAASRLSEQFSVPTVMICLSGENGKGSCRSCGDFNLYDALAACSEWLDGFGGHALAAGLNIRRSAVEGFRTALNDYYQAHRPRPRPEVSCDLLLRDGRLLTIENVRDLDLLEPYGSANPRPVFCVSPARLVTAYGVGTEKQHLKFSVEFDGRRFDGIFFSHTKEKLGIQPGDLIDLAFTPEINEYMGSVSVQLTACGMRPHCAAELCEKILEQDRTSLWAAASFAPERRDFVEAWRTIKCKVQSAKCKEDEHTQIQRLLAMCPSGMAPERFCLCLAVFAEAGLVRREAAGLYSVCGGREQKVDLEATAIMRALRAMLRTGV